MSDVLETLPAMACLLSPDYHVVFANKSFREKFGEAHGRHCYEYCFGQTEPCKFCESFKVFETGQPHRWLVMTQDGTTIEAYDLPFTDADGSPMVLEMDIDITEKVRVERALTEAKETLEKDYLHLLEHAPTGIYEIDFRGPRFKSVNDAMCRLTGFTRAELLSMDPNDMLDDESRARFLERVRKVMAGEKVSDSVEFTVKTKDGRRLCVLLNVRPTLENGKPVGALVVGHDITERKKMENAIRNERNLLQTLIDGPKNMHLVYLDRDFNFLRVNEAYARTCGYTPKEMIGKNHFALYPDEEVERIFAKVRDTGVPVEFHDRPFVFPDQPERGVTYWDWDLEPIKDDANHVQGLVFSLVDTTEKKKAELALAEELADAHVLSNLSLRPLREDIHAFYQEIMDAAVLMTGAKMGTLQVLEGDSLRIVASRGHTQPFLDFFADAELVASVCGTAADRGERVVVRDVEKSSLFADTKSLDVLRADQVRAVQSTPLTSRTGHLLGVLTTQWDIPFEPSERDLWRLDLLARQAADLIEQRRSGEELRTYAARLERSNAEWEQFAHVASHDLREPLRAISGYMSLVEQDYSVKLDDKGKKYIKSAVNGSIRMGELIDDLIQFSKVSSPTTPFSEVDMNEVAAKAISNLAEIKKETDGQVTVDSLPTIMGNEQQMIQLLQNLIGNALKFHGKERPSVHISARVQSDKAVFSVADNGIGLNMAEADKIFRMFQRLHSASEYPGRGIGLAIAKNIVSRHGGRIWVEAEEGKGSNFCFSLPLSAKAVA